MSVSVRYGFAILLSAACMSSASCNRPGNAGSDTGNTTVQEDVSNAYHGSDKTVVPKHSDNIYHLVDPKTQMLILQYKHPDGWITGGNAHWLTNSPNMPHSWYAWTASPDGEMKFAFSSTIQMGGQGRIGQNPMLNDASILAKQLFIPAAQNDYNLTNVSIKDAKFAPDPNAAQKQQAIAKDVTNYGMRATDVRCLIYALDLTGTRDGKPYFVSYMAPVNIIETRPGRGYTHTFEMVQLVSAGGPIGSEETVAKLMNDSVSTVEMNPNFIQFRTQMAQMQTQQAIAEINKKFEVMRQRHLQNMAESDARLNNFLQESDRKHAQVMGRSGGGGGGGGSTGSSGSMLDKWDEYIKDVDMVQNPNSGEDMYIDNRYEHAWINSDNEVMYMDSSLFNPNENKAFNHREWKKVR